MEWEGGGGGGGTLEGGKPSSPGLGEGKPRRGGTPLGGVMPAGAERTGGGTPAGMPDKADSEPDNPDAMVSGSEGEVADGGGGGGGGPAEKPASEDPGLCLPGSGKGGGPSRLGGPRGGPRRSAGGKFPSPFRPLKWGKGGGAPGGGGGGGGNR